MGEDDPDQTLGRSCKKADFAFVTIPTHEPHLFVTTDIAHGTWPRRNSGPIWQAQGENWYEVGYALRHGTRGLPRCGSLARFLTKTRGARNHKALPPFSVKDILRWAVACHDGTGNWPTPMSGPVLEAPGETWLAVDAALRTGLRGLPGGSSLSKIMRPLRHKNCM
jgi:hypothetical protein